MKNRETKMSWHLHEMMAKRGILTATQLQRMLRDVGVSLSSAHLSTFVSGQPLRVSDELMYGLTTVLKCSAADLWKNPGAQPAQHKEKLDGQEDSDVSRVEPKTKKKPRDVETTAAGPKLRPFPKPEPASSKE